MRERNSNTVHCNSWVISLWRPLVLEILFWMTTQHMLTGRNQANNGTKRRKWNRSLLFNLYRYALLHISLKLMFYANTLDFSCRYENQPNHPEVIHIIIYVNKIHCFDSFILQGFTREKVPFCKLFAVVTLLEFSSWFILTLINNKKL